MDWKTQQGRGSESMGKSCPNWFMNEQELWGSTDWDLGTYKRGKQHVSYVSLGRKTARWEVLGKVCFVSLGSCHSGIISVLLQLPHSLSSPLFSLPPPLKDLSLELRGKYRYSLWKYERNLILQKEVSNKFNTKNNFLSWVLPSASCFYRKSGVLITHL